MSTRPVSPRKVRATLAILLVAAAVAALALQSCGGKPPGDPGSPSAQPDPQSMPVT